MPSERLSRDDDRHGGTRGAAHAPPVLVFGAGVTLLGVVRSLGRAGIPLYVASGTRDFVAQSRWYRPAPQTLSETADPAALAAFLARQPFRRAVLMPCSDAWSTAVSGLDPRTLERFPASISRPEVQKALLDKGEFRRVLDRLGLPHPRTRDIDSEEDLERLPDSEFEGAFLKPRDSQAFSATFGEKAFSCRGKREAVSRQRQAASRGLAMMLQDYIPGPPTHHVFLDGFIDRTGRLVALFARRRIRMHPPDFGNSSCLLSVPPGDVGDAPDTVLRLLSDLGFRGIFSAELKYDARDGRHKLLEVNARPWWYVAFAADCGVDVCRMAYQDALGLDVEEPPPYAVGKRCVFAQLDWAQCLGLWRRGQMSAMRWVHEWISSVHPVFEWTDPAPAMRNFVHLLPRVLGKRTVDTPRADAARVR